MCCRGFRPIVGERRFRKPYGQHARGGEVPEPSEHIGGVKGSPFLVPYAMEHGLLILVMGGASHAESFREFLYRW
jgi:hypothetical protein